MKTIDRDLLQKIRLQNIEYEKLILNERATFSYNYKRKMEEKEDIRNLFSRDADRILHSLAYSRYYDKTQVFFWIDSDIFQRRMHHVQLVSRLGREIGRILRLNEDLIEAIALGHDIGHVPFGHDGERFLDKITQKNGIGRFFHNYESVWFLNVIEKQNLTLPVLDGILGHNGEQHPRMLKPKKDDLNWETFEKEMEGVMKGTLSDPRPKTLEGCLVRFVDTISYISRDIRDAEYLGLTSFEDIPERVKDVLGKSNREIINSLVSDLIENSINNDYISYSKEIHEALRELYRFNLKNIYEHEEKTKRYPKIKEGFETLWDYYLKDLEEGNTDSEIYKNHLLLNLKEINLRYKDIKTLDDYDYSKEDNRIIVRDFIAGMTNTYYDKLIEKLNPDLIIEKQMIF